MKEFLVGFEPREVRLSCVFLAILNSCDDFILRMSFKYVWFEPADSYSMWLLNQRNKSKSAINVTVFGTGREFNTYPAGTESMPGCTPMQSYQALYCLLTILCSHLDIPKIIMESSKTRSCIIQFQKFSRLRVKCEVDFEIILLVLWM